MTKTRGMPALLAGCLVLAAGALPAAAQQYTLRLNHVHSPSEPYQQAFTNWAERVKERTDGNLVIEVFHSAQLGVEEDIIEQIRMGANVGQNTDAARLGNYVKEIAVVNGPYFVNTLEDAFRLSDLEIMKEWEERLAREAGIRIVCSDFVQGKRHFFTNRPVQAPADLSGQRIRTPPAPIWQESVRALGAQPTAMSYGDIYPGLQQRAVDGAELTFTNVVAGNFNEVLTHFSETGHILLKNYEIVSAQWFDSLPADYQTALVEECRTAGQEVSRQLEEMAAADRQKLVDAGMTPAEDVDLEAFREAGLGAYEALGLTEARQAVLDELGR
ncbi:C4-dicarboxylate TRAP transporter substrate-binding protein [Cereibacter azotoformans]|uniref:C4-dicarboxylate TRAP transporter substrate-binding protein n=1 Tax=Cereibacter azotoformans TaxID=43057 RepID=UPI001EEA3B67|nr:C4-dicarboxylate TRAP transporter substrate-binding protein [Cereibacter azotoformans]ULB11596.1 C4-dicarboxylate TRAP transporter substrate-binding protein [Cereibacter azotoformans]